MLLYPDAMKKGQAELDAVLGSSRFPTFDDKDKLPYIDAIVKETLRWRPVSAGGIPHAVIQDDEYMGYHIPAGATVIGNHWSMHLDENVYNDPYAFIPDRWIEHPDLPLAAFGFGRRICTGQHIAKNSLFINIARILWTFDIDYKYDVVNGMKQRREVDPFAFTQGFNSHPVKFEATFVPREARATVVKTIWEEAETDLDVVMGRVPLENAES
jgi:cytochrome P450